MVNVAIRRKFHLRITPKILRSPSVVDSKTFLGPLDTAYKKQPSRIATPGVERDDGNGVQKLAHYFSFVIDSWLAVIRRAL